MTPSKPLEQDSGLPSVWGEPDSDVLFLMRQSTFTGYQAASFIIPPTYMVYGLFARSRPNFFNRCMRATWIGGLAGVYTLIVERTLELIILNGST